MLDDLRVDHRGAGPLRFETLAKTQMTVSRTWFRGEHCNFGPDCESMRGPEAVLHYILKGWTPEQPFIGPETTVTAFGSCFAANITKWLVRRRYRVLTADSSSNAYVVRFGEGMVTTFALRQQFEWAFENWRPSGTLWRDAGAQLQGYEEEVREKTRAIFDASDVFILTLGLSEVWFDKETGEVLWRAPSATEDPSRYGFRVSGMLENLENLRAIHRSIRRHRPGAKIILTLSPIPLVATFRPVSCVTANWESKAILRAAVGEFLRETDDPDLHYWPSYEIAMDVFSDRWTEDRRHLRPEVLRFIMILFESVWCHGVMQKSVAKAWAQARVATGTLPVGVREAIHDGDSHKLARIAKVQKSPADQAFLLDLAGELH